MVSRSDIMKQYATLVKNIESFSNDQASISEDQPDDDSLTIFNVTIVPNDGLYRHGKFKFQFDISDGYPSQNPPRIRCLTKVYHPNIDQIDEYSEGDICLNLIDELWSPDLTLEDYVQGLLFMFYNPNFSDPLNPAFDGSGSDPDTHHNIRQSMRGEEIDGMDYDKVLPDGYESDDDYKESYIPVKDDSDDSDTDDDEEEVSNVNMSLDTNTMLNDKTTLSVIEESTETESDLKSEATPTIDKATGQPVSINIKPVSSLVSVITRVVRFLRPSMLTSNGAVNVNALRSDLGSVVIYGVAVFAFRLGLRILLRTPLINVVR